MVRTARRDCMRPDGLTASAQFQEQLKLLEELVPTLSVRSEDTLAEEKLW